MQAEQKTSVDEDKKSLFQTWKDQQGEYPATTRSVPNIPRSNRSASASVCSVRSYAASMLGSSRPNSNYTVRSCCGQAPSSQSLGNKSLSVSSMSSEDDSWLLKMDDATDFRTTYDTSYTVQNGDGVPATLDENSAHLRSELQRSRREALRRAALQFLGRQEERDREYESKLRSIILKRKLKAHQKEELEFKEAYDLLVEKRRNYFPDPSFDLDGDGIVGVRDFYIASRFDVDKDGRLNEQELANAKQAIANGFGQNKLKLTNKDINLPKGHYYSYQGTFHRFLGQGDDADEWKALNLISSDNPSTF